MEVEVQDSGIEPKIGPKSLTGRMPKNYDGTTPHPDPMQEEYINRIIYNMGNRVKSYEEVYRPDTNAPNYSSKAAYKFFERKGFLKRYNFLMNQAMYAAGIDKKTLLLKTAALIEDAVEKKKVKDFTNLVDTVLKLQTNENKYRALNQERSVNPQIDLKPIQDLMESLNQ